jgi:predicted dehydrogenase
MPRPQARHRTAIVGTGRIASLLERDPLRRKPHTHAAWYAADPRTTLVTGCDVDAQRLETFGQDWGIDTTHLYAEYSTMLERERPDLVSVCAYAADRIAMSRAAVAAGARGLWIEKAIACSVDDAEALACELQEQEVASVVDHPRRLDPRYRAVSRWVREQTFGRLESIHVLFSGHVMHTGTHAWDLLLDWCGPWARVDASLDTAAHEAAASGDEHERTEADVMRYAEALRDGFQDRGGRARIVFENGTEAFVTGGAKRYFVFQCDLVCARGRVRIGNDVWETLVPEASPRYSGYRELAMTDASTYMRAGEDAPVSVLGDLLDAMQTGDAPVLSVRGAVEALALGVAVMQSGLTGRTVTPATLDKTLRIASI